MNGSGTLAGTGTVSRDVTVFDGTISPGVSGPGVLTFAEDLRLADEDSTFVVQIAGPGDPGQPDGHDQLVVAGEADLDGVVDVALLNDFKPTGLMDFIV